MLKLAKTWGTGLFALYVSFVLPGCGGGGADPAKTPLETKSPAENQQDQEDSGSGTKPDSTNAEQGSGSK